MGLKAKKGSSSGKKAELKRQRTRRMAGHAERSAGAKALTTAGLGSILVSSALLGGTAHALPQGGSVVKGDATISQPSATQLNVNQASGKAVINWQGFSIDANEAVRFYQPGSNAVAMNRVTGIDPSRLYGLLSANGKVFVINPNGLVIGPGGRIETAGFVGSTLNLADEDFLAGRYNFKGPGAPGASVVNQGTILVSDGGFVVLAAPTVLNEGKIVATLGTVQLASGQEVTLNFAGDDLVGLVIDKATANGLVANKGTITADGGTVVLAARSVSDALKTVVNNEGVIEARSLVEKDGKIFLTGNEGIAENQGTLDVSGVGAASGGTVAVTGRAAVLGEGSVIKAEGGAAGGDGGFVDLSGEAVGLGGTVSTLAPRGDTGTLLIDPATVTLANVTQQSDVMIFDAQGNGSLNPSVVIPALQVEQLLNTTNVNIRTAQFAANPGDGDINVYAPITNLSGHNLTLTADADISIGDPLHLGGTLTLSATKGTIRNEAAGTATDINHVYTDAGGTTHATVIHHVATGGTITAPVLVAHSKFGVDLDQVLGGLAVGQITADATAAGDIFLSTTGDTELVSVTTFDGDVEVGTSLGNLTATAVSAGDNNASGNGNVILQTVGVGDIVLGSVDAAHTAIVAAADSISMTADADPLTAGSALLAAGGSIDVQTDIAILDAHAGGPITIDSVNLAPVLLDNVTTEAGDVTVTAAGALTVNSVVAGGAAEGDGDVSLTTTAGGIAVGSISAEGDTVTLNAAGAITDGNGATVNVTAATLDATAGDNVAGVAIDLDTAVSSLSAAATDTGSIHLDNTGDVTLTSVSTTDGDIDVTAAGAVTATSVTAGGAGNNVTISGDSIEVGSIAADDTVTLTATVGGITDGIDRDVSPNAWNITAGTADLTAVTAIGTIDDFLTASGAPLHLSVDTFSAATSGDGSQINLLLNGDWTVTGDEVNIGGNHYGQAILAATGDLDVSGADFNLTGGDDLGLIAGGTLTLPDAGLSTGGDLYLAGSSVVDPNLNNDDVLILSADNLVFRSGVGAALSTDVNTVDAVVAAGNLAVTNDGDLTVYQAASAGDVTITSLNGGIKVAGPVTADAESGEVTLDAQDGSITKSGSDSLVTADYLDAHAAGSIDLNTNVNSLDANADGGSITIDEADGVALGTVIANGDVTVTAHGTLTGTDVEGDTVTVSTTTGDITLDNVQASLFNATAEDGNVTATAVDADLVLGEVVASGDVTLAATDPDADGEGRILDGTGGSVTNITGTNVSLTAANGIGTITDFENLEGDAVTIALNGDGTLTKAFTDAGDVNLSVDGSVVLGEDIGTNGAGAKILIQATGDISAPSLDLGDKSMGLIAGGALSTPGDGITTTGDLRIEGATVTGGLTFSADDLVFSVGSGDAELTTDVNSVTARITTGAGNLTIDNDKALVVKGASTFDGDISISAQGDLTLGTGTDDGLVAAGGVDEAGLKTHDVTLVAPEGSIVDGNNDLSQEGNPVYNLNVSGRNLTVRADNDVELDTDVAVVEITGTTPIDSWYNSVGGDVTLRNAGDLVVNQILSDGNVFLSAAGAVSSGENFWWYNVSADDFEVHATTGIDLTTSVNTLMASTSEAGDIRIINDGSLDVTSATTTDGSVSIFAAGSMTANTVTANGADTSVVLSAIRDMTLGEVSAGLAVNLSAGQSILSDGDAAVNVTAPSLVAEAGNNIILATDIATLDARSWGGGAVTIGNGNADLRVDGLATTGPATLTAGNVLLNDLSGNLNANVTATSISGAISGNLTLTTPGGENLVLGRPDDAGTPDVDETTALAVGGSLQATAGVHIDLWAPVTAHDAVLVATQGSIDGNGGPGSLTVETTAALRAAQGSVWALSAAGQQLTVSSGFGVWIDTDVDTLSVTNGMNGVRVWEANDLNLTRVTTAGGDVFVGTGFDGQGPSQLRLGTITDVGGEVRISSNGGVVDANGAALNITAKNLDLANGGGFGTAADAIETKVSTLTGFNIMGGTVNIANTGNLTVGGFSNDGDVKLSSTGAIKDGNLGDVNITANGLTLTAVAGIDLDTQVASLSATNTGSGVVDVSNQGDLVVHGVANGTRAVTLGATGSLLDTGTAAVDVTAGMLTLTAAGGIDLDATATGLAATNTNSGAIDVTNTTNLGVYLIDNGNRDVSLAVQGTISDKNAAANNVTAGHFTVSAANGLGLNTQVASLTATNANNANLIISNTGDLLVDDIHSAGGTVRLTAIGGSISDGGDVGVDVTTAGGLVDLTAANGIHLDTAAARLQASNTAAGSVYVSNTGALALYTVANGARTDGRLVTIKATGAITDKNGVGVNNVTAGDLRLEAVGGISADTNVARLIAINGAPGTIRVANTGALAFYARNNGSAVTGVNVTSTLGAGGLSALANGSVFRVAAPGAVHPAAPAAADAGWHNLLPSVEVLNNLLWLEDKRAKHAEAVIESCTAEDTLGTGLMQLVLK